MFETGAIHVLKDDHRVVRQLLNELVEARSDSEQERLRGLAAVELKLHQCIKEEIFFPALDGVFETTPDRLTLRRVEEEHHLADVALQDLLAADPGTARFTAAAQILQELVRLHSDEEERSLFPRVKKALDHEALAALAEDLHTRKDELRIEVEQEILAQTT